MTDREEEMRAAIERAEQQEEEEEDRPYVRLVPWVIDEEEVREGIFQETWGHKIWGLTQTVKRPCVNCDGGGFFIRRRELVE